jgi:plastocyanin
MIATTTNVSRVLAALGAAIVVAGLACRTGSSFAASGGREEPAAVIVISDAPSEFMPRTIKVKVGDTVQWSNTGGIAHSVEFVGEVLPKGTASSESGIMAPKKSYSFTFDAPGTYAYICRFHVINGMIGKIVVTPSEPSASATASAR